MVEHSPYLQENVEVLVSDNASTDNTRQLLENFDEGRMRFRWVSQVENLGLDGNMRYLYQHSQAEYVWYFSDDDVLYPGAIERVLGVLKISLPEGLLFSFVQPIGSAVRIFDYPDDVAIINEPEQMIRLLARFPKLSIYVYKRIDLSEKDWDDLKQFLGSNYNFIAVGYTVLQKSISPKLCIISEPLAGCDENFNQIRFSPETWGNAWVVFQHPYAKKMAPFLEKIKRQEGYYDQIQALFAVKSGALKVEDISTYDQFIRSLKVRWIWLLQRPKSFVQIFFLKFGIVPLYLKLVRRSR